MIKESKINTIDPILYPRLNFILCFSRCFFIWICFSCWPVNCFIHIQQISSNFIWLLLSCVTLGDIKVIFAFLCVLWSNDTWELFLVNRILVNIHFSFLSIPLIHLLKLIFSQIIIEIWRFYRIWIHKILGPFVNFLIKRKTLQSWARLTIHTRLLLSNFMY